MKTLIIAPHLDDEVIGCGGIIAKRTRTGNEVWVCIVTEGKYPMYSKRFIEDERKEALSAHKVLGTNHTICLGYPSARLDGIPQYKINDRLAGILDSIKPDEIFIPHRGDMHKDHQIVADAAMVALRPHKKNRPQRVLSYEVLSETDWNTPNQQNAFIPNVYEDISDYIDLKVTAMNKYRSQLKQYPDARSLEGIESLAMHRGVVVGVKYAEAFMLVREVVK